MTCTVLALGHPHKEIRAVNLCTQETWDKALAPFPDKIRWEAGNLAAHGWDVLMLDDVLFIGGSDTSYYYTQDGKKIVATIEQRDIFYPRVPSTALQASKHWEDSKKLGVDVYRERKINLSGIAGTQTFRMKYAALEAVYSELTDYKRSWKLSSGEELDYRKKFERIKNKLQKLWNELSAIENG